MGGLGRQPAWEPEWECGHGRMPFDNTPACGCWPVEVPGFVQEVAPVSLHVQRCQCGCGDRAPIGRRFVQGHNLRRAA